MTGSGSASDVDDQVPVCGEMVFDVALADEDTDIHHECGEWRPKIMVQPEASSTVYDYSYHHPGGGYYGGYGASFSGGTPTPVTEPGSEGTEPMTTDPEGPVNVDDLPPIPSIDETAPSNFRETEQAQHGWSAPQSPAMSQRVNIYPARAGKNIVGTWIKTKPQGYSKLQVDTWIRVSDFIPVGQQIVMNLKVGQWASDKGPVAFGTQRIVLTSSNVSPTKFKRVFQAFTGFDKTRSRAVSFYYERRNDLFTPVVDVEVFIVRHLVRWFP